MNIAHRLPAVLVSTCVLLGTAGIGALAATPATTPGAPSRGAPASPRPASPRPPSPRPASPRPPSPRPASPRPGVAHVISRGQALARAALRYRSGQYVDLVAARTVSFVIPAGERYTVSLVGVPRQVSGPLTAGAPEGSAVIRTGARIVGQVPVVTARAVSAATLGQRLGDYFSRAVTLALLGGLVVCSLLLVVLRRRANRRREARVDRRAGTEVA